MLKQTNHTLPTDKIVGIVVSDRPLRYHTKITKSLKVSHRCSIPVLTNGCVIRFTTDGVIRGHEIKNRPVKFDLVDPALMKIANIVDMATGERYNIP